MKVLGTLSCMTTTVLIVLVVGLLCTSVDAQFTCGGDLLTYQVQSLENVPGTGVRCVKFYPQGATLMVWYGEGRWGEQPGRPYRHVGIAFRGGSDIGITGRAGDIIGNGEDYGGTANGLVLQLSSADLSGPGAIVVTGNWKEKWILSPGGVNYNPLNRPSVCGPNFVQYGVRSLDGTPGSGNRCILRMPGTSPSTPREGSPPYTTVWFGNGNWRGVTYTHIGRVSMSSSVSNSLAGTGEASDICDLGRFCGSAPENSLHFVYRTVPCNNPTPPPYRVPAFSGYAVGGHWNEVWSVTEPPCDL
jgi:hypothetical protein